MLKKVALGAFLMLFVGQSLAFAEGQIGHRFKKHPTVKVYLADFTNESGQAQISADTFKENVEKSFLKRKSMNFEVVKTPSESHVQVSCIIKKYQYLDKGPLKMTPSIPGIALDAMATQTGNYVEMEAAFTVTDTKNNAVVWNGIVSEYIKKPMTPENSIPMIYDKVSRNFVAECFGKPGR